jgi:hypothetical protein
MKARRLIESALYDPEQLKALRKAFDEAWEGIASGVSTRPAAIEAARLKLAEIVLGLAKNGNLDPQQLADAAVQLMRSPPQKLRP